MKFYARCLEVLNQNSKKSSKLKLQRTNKYAKVVALSLALSMVLGVSGCSKTDEKAEVETGSTIETSGSADEVGTNDNEIEENSEFSLLADQLIIDGLTMTDDLTEKVEAELNKQLEAINPGGNNYSPSDVYVAPDGSTWVSEEAYNNFIDNGGSTNSTTEGYLAPDGNVWESEQAYLDYIAGQGESSTTIEGDFYTAPDGTIWSSKEEYEKYVASNNGQNEIPVENGTVVEEGEGYRAPDGTYWSSEQDYLDYISSLNSNSNNEQNNNNNNQNSNNTDTGASSNETESYYTAPDGTIWDSEASYLAYIDGMNAASSSYEEVGGSYEETVTYDNDYYFAPDGSVWESETAYLEFIGSNSSSYETGKSSESTVEVIPESQYEEPTETYTEDMSSYYQDEDGNWWASYEDYLLYKQNEANLSK